MSLLSISQASHFVRASTAFTIRVSSTGFNRWQTSIRLLRKTEWGSPRTGEMRSPSRTSTSSQWWVPIATVSIWGHVGCTARSHQDGEASNRNLLFARYVQFIAHHTTQYQRQDGLLRRRFKRWSKKKSSSRLVQNGTALSFLHPRRIAHWDSVPTTANAARWQWEIYIRGQAWTSVSTPL